MIKTVTIVGGSGLIGTALARSFFEDGTHVQILDIEAPHHTVSTLVDWVPCDVRSRSDLAALRPCGLVVHLAALLGKGCSEEPARAWDTNVIGLANVIEAVRGLPKPPPICFLSSASVYAPATSGPIHEGAPTASGSIYAASKLAGENMLAAAGMAFGIRSFILRPFTAYGPGPGSGAKGHFVWNWIERAKRGDPLVVHGDGTQTVDLVHTADLAKLCKQAAMRDVACANPPAFNVGSGAETPLLDLMAWFREEFPGVRFNVDPKLRPNQHRNFADIRRAQQMIGYVPSIDPRSGIRSVIRWSLQDN